MKAKKIISILMVTLLCLFTFVPVLAAESTDRESFEKHTIAVDEVPDGITPDVANSEEEADAMAGELFNSLKQMSSEPTTEIIVENSGIQPRNYVTFRNTIYRKLNSINLAGTKFAVEASVRVRCFNRPNGNIEVVDAVNYTSCYLEGFTMAIELVDTSAYTSVYNNGKTFTSYGAGTINYYVLINGVMKYYSSRVTIDNTVNL